MLLGCIGFLLFVAAYPLYAFRERELEKVAFATPQTKITIAFHSSWIGGALCMLVAIFRAL